MGTRTPMEIAARFALKQVDRARRKLTARERYNLQTATMAKLRSRRIERGDVERESCDGCGADFWDRASVVDALGGVDELDEMLCPTCVEKGRSS